MKTLPYVIKGTVVHGKALGRTVGMPTANLNVMGKELPAPGVYATLIEIDNEVYQSVTNIGTRPSVDQDSTITVETYIMNFTENIYGKTVSLKICEYLRPIMKFNDLEEVRMQVQKDILAAEECFKM